MSIIGDQQSSSSSSAAAAVTRMISYLTQSKSKVTDELACL
jgi:hypothetical protein